MRLSWLFVLSLCGLSGLAQNEVNFSRPTAGTADQRLRRGALEQRLIGQVVLGFPDNLFETGVDFSEWNKVVNDIAKFVILNSRYDAHIYSALMQAIGFSDLLIRIIEDVKTHKLAIQEAAAKLDLLDSTISSAKPPTFSDKGQRESMELVTILRGYVKASTEGVTKLIKAPGFDIINKSGNPIYVLTINDPRGFGKGKTMREKEGEAVLVEAQKNFAKRINIKKKTLVLIYKEKPDASIYDLKIEGGVELPCEHAYLVEETMPETIYVTYSDEKGLYPQTGKLGGWWGTTSGGFAQDKNIVPSHLKEVCVENKVKL